jgi:DNA-damage-inducible protein J
MIKSAIVSAHIDPEVKRAAEEVFADIGLSVSDAVELFYRQVERTNGLPFEARVPNEETRQALKEAEHRTGLTSHDSVQGMFDDILRESE